MRGITLRVRMRVRPMSAAMMWLTMMRRMPRRLTPLDEGLRSYLATGAGAGSLSFDGHSAGESIPIQGAGAGASSSH
jgi:hypothetical protein